MLVFVIDTDDRTFPYIRGLADTSYTEPSRAR